MNHVLSFTSRYYVQTDPYLIKTNGPTTSQIGIEKQRMTISEKRDCHFYRCVFPYPDPAESPSAHQPTPPLSRLMMNENPCRYYLHSHFCIIRVVSRKVGTYL